MTVRSDPDRRALDILDELRLRWKAKAEEHRAAGETVYFEQCERCWIALGEAHDRVRKAVEA